MNSFVSATVALAISLGVGMGAHAQCTLAWDPQFGPAGASHITSSSAVFDDGSGPALYVGGEFTSIGGIDTNYIARFDGEQWSKVGGTFSSNVLALAVYDDGNEAALYATGNFTDIGGTAFQGIARWNGTTWSAPPGGSFDSPPTFLYASSAPTGQPRLYATGPFTTLGGNPIGRLAVYDGSTWTSVPGLPNSISIRVVEFDDPATPQSDLFISPSIAGIYRYDGTSLVNIAPSGIGGGSVFTMERYDDGNGPCLYVGGNFSSVNGVSASRIAKWNGSIWSDVAGGVTSTVQHLVRDLRVWDDGNGPALYVGGRFETAGSTPATQIARWNGTAWSAVGTSIGTSPSGFPEVKDMIPFDAGAGEGLAVLGDFTTPKQFIAFWTGTEFRGIGGTNGVGVVTPASQIFDFVVYEDPDDGPLMVAGGNFQNAGPVPALRVAAWNGHAWRALGAGFNNTVRALALFDDGGGTKLYASGQFGLFDGLARWNGTQWETVLTNTSLTIAAADMVVFDDGNGPKLYLAGNGQPGMGVVARLDGTQLTQIGSALGREIIALGVFDNGSSQTLFLGTTSTAFGPSANDSILRWDGSSWVTVAGGLQRTVLQSVVRCFMTFDDNGTPKLAVGGTFDQAGAVVANGLIYWDGTQWAAPPGTQPTSASVSAITIHDDGTGPAFFAASINSASTAYDDRIAKLGASGWEPLAFGLNGAVNAMCSYDPEGGSSLYLGGTLTRYWSTANQLISESVRSAGIARWHTCLDEPMIISPPGGQSVPPATNVEFTVEADGGDLAYRWRRDGVPLDNNAQQTGVDLPQLTLFNVDENDEGDYDVVVTNVAGSATSDAATLTITLPCFADIDNDNQVSINDLLEVINNWGACPGTCPPACSADVDPSPNGDCQVNINDLLLVINSWGSCP